MLTETMVCTAAKHGIASLKKVRKREQQKEQDFVDSGFLAIRGRANSKGRKVNFAKGSKNRGLNEVKGFKAGLVKVHAGGMEKTAGNKRRPRTGPDRGL